MNPVKNYRFRHFLISWFRDIDLKGFRYISVILPKILLPGKKMLQPYVLKTLHDVILWIDPAKDNGVELSLHETGTYEKGILNFLEKNLGRGDVFVDVGANIGLMSLIAARRVGEEGKVLAFEPQPDTFGLLSKNIELNSFKNIKVFGFALGAVNQDDKDLYIDDKNRGGASLIFKNENNNSCLVNLRTLDSVIPNGVSPKIIKIDVEGFEMHVLKGASKTIGLHQPILILELMSGSSEELFQDLLNYVKSLGNYKLYRLKGGKERKSHLREVNSFNELPSHDNIVFITDDIKYKLKLLN